MTGSESGSIFVDTVIAAAIVAMTIGGAFHVLADVAARQRDMEARRGAILVAQSELAAVGSEIPVGPGSTAGLSGPFAWRVDISPYEQGGAPVSAAGRLWRIDVAVGRREGGPALSNLRSLRLGADG